MFCCIYLGSEKCTGRSTEIFEINLLRTWCVYITSRKVVKMLHKAHLFWLLLEGKVALRPGILVQNMLGPVPPPPSPQQCFLLFSRSRPTSTEPQMCFALPSLLVVAWGPPHPHGGPWLSIAFSYRRRLGWGRGRLVAIEIPV